jgi:hypothetical protein
MPSHAQREISRLRRRVQDLEQQLSGRTPVSNTQLQAPSTLDPLHSVDDACIRDKDGAAGVRVFEGVSIRTARSVQKTWYGPSSLHYFTRRTATFLSSALQQAVSADGMLPNGESMLIHGPTATLGEDTKRPNPQPTEDSSFTSGKTLTPTQEEYFLSLYWHSYHTALFPILDEEEFRDHYRSLWTASSGTDRQPSALVDIVLAICMQHGVSKLPVTKQGAIADSKDATIAGRWHYRRGQMLLANELESPTIMTLQSHLLSVMFLCYASFQNMADNACALAVRTAYMLGLHIDPPQSLPLKEREMRRRLWWALYLLDSKIGMKLGRPFHLRDTHAMPGLPCDSAEAAMVSGSNFAPLGNNGSWLSFSLQSVKLFLAARTVHLTCYDKCLNIGNCQSPWDDPQALESFADSFGPFMRLMDDWANGVPDTLKTSREDNGIPFSTHRSALEIEQFAPTWLQRQRILLELMYHNLCINLLRPLIPLASTGSVPTPRTEAYATMCAAHAMALTNIVYQVLSDTSILDGWIEAFQFQWNAAMTLVGFILAYPCLSSTAPAARAAIDVAVSIFDVFGKSFKVATSAASIMRDLGIKADIVLEQNRIRSGNISSNSWVEPYPMLSTNQPSDDLIFPGLSEQHTSQFDDMASQDLFDITMGVDLWSDLDALWQNAGGIFPEIVQN